jgi:hypothetical protein
VQLPYPQLHATVVGGVYLLTVITAGKGTETGVLRYPGVVLRGEHDCFLPELDEPGEETRSLWHTHQLK